MDTQLAGAQWLRRVLDYDRIVEGELEAVEHIQTLAAGRAAMGRFEEKWERVTNAYAGLGVSHPEPENLNNLPQSVAFIYYQCAAQWRNAVKEYDSGYKAITSKLTTLQVVAEPEAQTRPTGAQRARTRVHTRYQVYHQIMKRARRLKTDIEEADPSACMAAAESFNDERKEIQALVERLEEVTSAIQEADQETYEAERNEFDGQDTEVAFGLDEAEQHYARFTRDCKKVVYEEALAASLLANPTSGSQLIPSRCCGGPLKFPRYSGELADYPTWREDWRQLVHGKIEEPVELIKLRDAVPKEAQVELKAMNTLTAAWEFLDEEFGQKDRITAERMSYLGAFQVSDGARTVHAKFKELHVVWREVYTDLLKIDAAQSLDNAFVLESFASKFPQAVQLAYAKYLGEQAVPGADTLNLMNQFMEQQRRYMRKLEQYESVSATPRGATAAKVAKYANTAWSSRAHGPDCPVCKNVHSYTGRDGRVRRSSRLAGCGKFYDLTKHEASLVESAGGCAWCPNRYGKHQAKNCHGGSCRVPWCDKKHHHLLHGSGIENCNLIPDKHVTDNKGRTRFRPNGSPKTLAKGAPS